MVGMWETPNWMMDVPLSSFQLLVAGGALLVFAGLLLIMRRRMRMEIESSIVTEEVMAYLGRIANALEAVSYTHLTLPTNREV